MLRTKIAYSCQSSNQRMCHRTSPLVHCGIRSQSNCQLSIEGCQILYHTQNESCRHYGCVNRTGRACKKWWLLVLCLTDEIVLCPSIVDTSIVSYKIDGKSGGVNALPLACLTRYMYTHCINYILLWLSWPLQTVLLPIPALLAFFYLKNSLPYRSEARYCCCIELVLSVLIAWYVVVAIGRICLDILKDKWTPSQNITPVALSSQALLGDTNPDDPLHNTVTELWKTNLAQAHTRRYGMGNTTHSHSHHTLSVLLSMIWCHNRLYVLF